MEHILRKLEMHLWQTAMLEMFLCAELVMILEKDQVR